MRPELKLVDEQVADVEAFTDAMSALASGVVLVTSSVRGRPWATTVTAFASVSVDPPTVLVSLRTDGTAARAIAATGGFGVAVLGAHQIEAAQAAAICGAEKFVSQETLAAAAAWLDCDVVRSVAIEDHTVFFGRVRTARIGADSAPLLYHRKRYLCPSS